MTYMKYTSEQVDKKVYPKYRYNVHMKPIFEQFEGGF